MNVDAYRIEVPVKAGQYVYRVVNDKRVKKPHKCKVVGLWIGEEPEYCSMELARYVGYNFDYSCTLPFEEMGKSVFFTEEEALNKMQENENAI